MAADATALAEGPWISVSRATTMATDGLITIKSAFGPEETMNRLKSEIRAKGLTVFADVDHAAAPAA